MSGELIIKEQTTVDGSDTFALPPAALSPSKMNTTSRRSSKSDPSLYFPASPTSPRLDPGRNANPPPQAGFKRPLEDLDLPPPPTRTRKIIQMKPKTQSSPKPATASSKPAAKGNAKAPSNGATPAANKKKQPSATSAAGRKIARKTAHSLIERRRRSKMNEEFATLKNMIPACRGQDMHKLAILQASIDYVNYLEKCIQDLKTGGDHKQPIHQTMPHAPLSPISPEVLGEIKGHTYSASVSPELPADGITTHGTSPMYSPRSRIPSISTATEIPTSVLPSPALGPIYASERTMSSAQSSWALPSSSRTSPAIQPRFSNASSADMDHEASAALLMLNRDCRGSIDSGHEGSVSSPSILRDENKFQLLETQRKKGMSVKDLLS
ncbi:hypothetical protein P175DRAFT_0529744 [Aspergillus ochraceoroseus IBT 24754]|nr:uncharacterized protein P175DRAFT_0529744 [Aspergillus ochraceoroseus IBT 24754]PTU22668.1 hypothetical protein P175DRAFT_0529744 [Aspergillus ochraceoroseus IBT 24754]